MRSAIDENGEIIARDVECFLDNGAYTGELASLACFPFHILGINYRIGHYRAVGRLVYTNTAPTAAMRGVSGVPLYAALELHMDSIAASWESIGANIGCAIFSLRATGSRTARFCVTPRSSGSSSMRLKLSRPGREVKARNNIRGRAVSPAVWLVNPLPGTATVKLQEDGSVVLLTAANENGTGSVATAFRQIVAEELGIDPDNVIIPDPDTDIGAFDAGSQGSRNTHVSGARRANGGAAARRRNHKGGGSIVAGAAGRSRIG